MPKDVLQPYAAVYPFNPKHIDRFFQGRNVFCKFTGQRTHGIAKGTKILFYASRSGYRILGEGTVESVDLLPSSEMFAKYAARVFINEREFENYRRLRSESIRILVAPLGNLKRYETPKKLTKPITMAGIFLNKEKYNNLMTQA